MQGPTVTIPLQTIPLKVHVHVSDVPKSQYLKAKIISAQPYYPPTDEQLISSDLARFKSLLRAQEGSQSALDPSNGERACRKQTAGDGGADESPSQDTQDEAVLVEMSGASGTLVFRTRIPSTVIVRHADCSSTSNWSCLNCVSLCNGFYLFMTATSLILILNSRTAQDSPRPRGTMLKTLRQSIGRSFKRSKMFSKQSDSVTTEKPGNVPSSERDHERELSALRGVIPRFSIFEGGPPNRSGIRGWCPTVHSFVVSHTSRSRTVNKWDEISLTFFLRNL